jgi:hypothetical protein
MDEGIREAKTVAATFRVAEDVYVVGSLERGVTVYGQQVRAHNLAWALSRLDTGSRSEFRFAIVGGGISGLTMVCCLLGLYPEASVVLFERTFDLCPLQQGSDSRWLHPTVYGWPAFGSRAPSASLPILTWSEGRASDVSAQVLRAFSDYVTRHRRLERLRVFLKVTDLRIDEREVKVEWDGNASVMTFGYLQLGDRRSMCETFDRIFLTVGFGLEISPSDHPTPSYWRNEQWGQPSLLAEPSKYILSGSGDGAIVDLCRLTIERFRQDQILYDLFGSELASREEALRPLLDRASKGENMFDAFVSVKSTELGSAIELLRARIRKDTTVVLHIASRTGTRKEFREAFGPTSSFMNRLLLFMLHSCDAFSLCFDELTKAKEANREATVICRHGPNPMNHLRSAFASETRIGPALEALKAAQGQAVQRYWEIGHFPR